MVRIPHCSSFQSSPNVQFSLGDSHGIGRKDQWLTSIPRNFCLKSGSQDTRSIFLVSAVTLSCLLQHLCFLLFIPFSISIYYLGFLFMLNLITAVVKDLSQHLSLGSVKTCKIRFLGLRTPNMTLSFPSTSLLIHSK